MFCPCSYDCFKTFLSLISIVTLLYLYISQKVLNNISSVTVSSNTTSLYEYKLPDVTLNIKSLRKFHEKDGTIFIPPSLEQIDWHNYTQIEYEVNITGMGEQGQSSAVSNGGFWMQELIDKYGYNTAISEKITLNRSLKDFRNERCKTKLYLKFLPTVSVIVVIHNEHLHTLLRTIVSILNRSPEHLIKEIFLVDNASTKESIKKILNKYVKENMEKVKVIRLAKKKGLARARVVAAKHATGNVLVFLDPHSEVTVNWLPPLLEPIALDYRTTVVPHINEISYYSFQYLSKKSERGIFNWTLHYKPVPITPRDKKLLPEPFETPVMWTMFAISRYFFWELGGYDHGFDELGGEQFELSFKIWQCGGRLLEIPCSHVGYIVPNEYDHVFVETQMDYPARNHRRIAEVWMDEYAQYLYARRPDYEVVDPGDLTAAKALRQRLKCKPFKWYMTQIAFDLPQQFPMVEPPLYAEGRIRPKLSPFLCIDGNNGKFDDVVELKPCHSEYVDSKYDEQQFEFTWYNDIKLKTRKMCLDLSDHEFGSHMRLFTCHHLGGNQQIRYLEETQQLVFKLDILCLDHNPKNRDLFLQKCDNNSETQAWLIDTVHKKKLDKWNENNTYRVTGPVEEWTDNNN